MKIRNAAGNWETLVCDCGNTAEVTETDETSGVAYFACSEKCEGFSLKLDEQILQETGEVTTPRKLADCE